ncbi:transglycosylase domain-containing protein [Chamaesiphon minutus]|uniref:transglycosylase domain-containing protein n=1 Tax=Chamaesiphon minutus TaxID=1173032 RepID=UPI0002EDE69B|nr:transglycosylase domain-containing protein [Chamaesiphon minutus]
MKNQSSNPYIQIKYHDNNGIPFDEPEFINGNIKSISAERKTGVIYIPSPILNEQYISIEKSNRIGIVDLLVEIIFGKYVTRKFLSPLLSLMLRHTGYKIVRSQSCSKDLSLKYNFAYYYFFKIKIISIISILRWIRAKLIKEGNIERQEIYHGDVFVIKRSGYSHNVKLTFHDRAPQYLSTKLRSLGSLSIKLISLLLIIIFSIIAWGAFSIDVSNLPDTRKPMEIQYAQDPQSDKVDILYRRSPDKKREEFSSHLINALIAKEDSRFYFSPGVDLLSFKNIGSRGGSGLTQQVARKLFAKELGFNKEQDIKNSGNRNELKLESDRLSFIRKLLEVGVSLKLDLMYSKQNILLTYLNRVSSSWEADEDKNSTNFEDRSKKYFDKSVDRLDSGESAMLVGMLTNPTVQDPCNQISAKRFIKIKINNLEEKIRENKKDLENATDENKQELQTLQKNRFYDELRLENLYNLERSGKITSEQIEEFKQYKVDPERYALIIRLVKEKEARLQFSQSELERKENLIETLKQGGLKSRQEGINLIDRVRGFFVKKHNEGLINKIKTEIDEINIKIETIRNEIDEIYQNIDVTKIRNYVTKVAKDNLQTYLDLEYDKVREFEISERAKDTREVVLNEMRKAGRINKGEYTQAMATGIRLKDPNLLCNAKSNLHELQVEYFSEAVNDELKLLERKNIIGAGLLKNKNYSIQTSIDRNMQEKAEEALQAYITTVGKKKNFDQGAILTLDTRNGSVKAMVGGYTDPNYQNLDPEDNQPINIYPGHGINHVTANNRQPGSIFKLFSYGAMMQDMHDRYKSSPALLLSKEYPCYVLKTGIKQCEHLAGQKKMNVFSAITYSENSVAIAAAKGLGIDKVKEFANTLGVGLSKPLNLKDIQGFVLGGGGNEVSLLEMTGAYAAVANGGTWNRPQIINSIKRLCQPEDTSWGFLYKPSKRGILSFMVLPN